MDPMTLLMMGSLGSQLGSLLGVGQTDPTYNQVNPLTDQYYRQIQEQMVQTQQAQEAANAQAQNAIGRSQGIQGQMAQTEQQLSAQQGPSAMDWFQNFMGSVPEYRQMAQGTAEQFSELAGRTLQEQTNQLQSQAVENAASQFGGQAFSGAAGAAVGQAAASPLAQQQGQLAQMQGQMANQTFNNLAGQGQGLAAQGTQNEFTNILNQLGQVLGSQQSRAGIEQGAAGLYNQQGGQFASLLQGLRGQQADVAQPMYQATPGEDPLGGLSQLLMGAAGLANYMGPNMNPGGGSVPGANGNDPNRWGGRY